MDATPEFVQAVAQRLEPATTYADADEDIVDGSLTEVVAAVLAELNATPDAAGRRESL